MGDAIVAKLSKFYPQEIRLYHKGNLLDMQSSLYNQNIRNADELFVVTRASVYDTNFESLEDVGGAEVKAGRP